MTKQTRTDEALWLAVQDLDRDLLDPATPASIIDDALRGCGLDPAQVRAEGRAIAAAALDKRRLAWMDAARQARDAMRARAKAKTIYAGMPRQLLLAELDRWRQHPNVGGEVRAAFRDRKPEESSDDDLRSLLEGLERVASMHEPDDG